MKYSLDFSFIASLTCLTLISGCAAYPIKYDFSSTSKEYMSPTPEGMSAVTGELNIPYESVCRVNTLRSYTGLFSGTYTGSAALLKNGILLTAAHNFYKPFYPSQVIKYNIQCGSGINEDHIGFSYDAKSKDEVIYKLPSAFQYHRYPTDFALVATCQTAESSFRLPNDADEVKALFEKQLITAGFPAESDKQLQGILLNGGQMFHTTISIEDSGAPGDTVRYCLDGRCIDTYKGQSGSPLWVKADDGYVIVGVHVAEAEAVIFNQDKIDWLKKQIEQLNNQCNAYY